MFHAGFDRADCPSIDMMSRLIKETNLVWCGYYLKAPSNSGKGWAGKRAILKAQGWGLAPIYVGQETVGPGSHVVTGPQGAIDGRAAVEAMKAEGFPPDSWVYLDNENGTPFTGPQHDYIKSWVDAVDGNGYRGGVYCSYLFAPEVAALRPNARIWAFRVGATKRHGISGNMFPAIDPRGATPVASIWQRDMNGSLLDYGVEPIDLDCSVMADPGAPDVAVAQRPAPAPMPAPIPDAPPPVVVVKSWWEKLMDRLFGARAA